jgi:peptide/nickel transport system permease protein
LGREKPLGTFGAVITLMLFFTGIFADILAPFGMNEIHLDNSLKPPSAAYWLGTDQMGRDMLSRCIYGARISMFVGLGCGTLCMLVSSFIGILSGFYGGKTDLFMQRFVDAVMCFPGMLIILSVMSVLGPGIVNVIVVLGVLRGIAISRVVRSEVLSIRERRYIDAAFALGCRNINTIWRHVLPNVLPIIIIISTAEMGRMIVIEASISFLGFGIPPPYPSWGGMLSGVGRDYMLQLPWLALWPGLFLSLAVFGINMFSDGMRDILDPRLKGKMSQFGTLKRKRKRTPK